MSAPTISRAGHGDNDTQVPSTGTGHLADHETSDPHLSLAGEAASTDHDAPELHGSDVGGGTSTSDPAKVAPAPTHATPESDGAPTSLGSTPNRTTSERPAPAIGNAVPMLAPPVLADPHLALAADVLDDLERVRIANENRLRQLTRTEADSDDELRGFGLDQRHPDVARLAKLVDSLLAAEHDAALQLCSQMRRHPLGPWVKAAKGVGEKQAARLLAVIGDPYWNDLHDRPRTVSELWAYCGYHVIRTGPNLSVPHTDHAGADGRDPGQEATDAHVDGAGVAATRTRGHRANWSTIAKTRVYLVAESCIKKRDSPYRPIYDEGRAKYADAVHPAACRRCGPAGKPAEAGSPLSAGHQHARAMRLVSKAILRDLWLEGRRLHAEAAA